MTRIGTVDLGTLEKERLASEAQRQVDERMSEIDDVEEQLRAATSIVQQADAEIRTMRRRRDELAMSASVYDDAIGLEDVLGISRAAVFEKRVQALQLTPVERDSKWLQKQLQKPDRKKVIADRARAAGVTHIDVDLVIADLPRAAELTFLAEERRAAALKARDNAIVWLVQQAGWSRQKAADVAGIDRAQVSRIASAAARVKAVA